MMSAFFGEQLRGQRCNSAEQENGTTTSYNSTLDMQERGGARWSRPRCVATVLAVQFLITLAIYHRPSEYSFENVRSSNTAQTAHTAQTANYQGHRHLLDSQNVLSSSVPSAPRTSTNDGIRGSLVHRPSDCSTLPAGTNASVGLSVLTEAERVQHTNCAVQRSASRVGFLLNRKLRDRGATAYGLPTRDIATVHRSGDSTDGKFLREMLDSVEWNESYESEVWSQPGEYLMTFQVGSPPRTLEGIVDTGSDLTWLQCYPCSRCYTQSDPVYQPIFSSTFRELDCAEEQCEDIPTSFCNIFADTCDYMYTYGDSSYTYGTLSTDSFTLGSTTGQGRAFPEIAFGCSHASRGTFTHTRADGVVALGQGALSLASQLGMHLSDRFGYCLVGRWDPTTITSPIFFGDSAILTGPGAGYTSILNNKRHQAYYYLSMTGISVGGKRLDISPDVFALSDDGDGGTIIDSGTTVTNLVGRAYDELLKSYSAAVEYPTTTSEVHFDLCFDTRGDRSDAKPRFPSLVLHLDGVDLDLPQDNYMMEAEEGTFCLSVDRSPRTLSVIGNIQQQNYRVLYDRENSRIGFQPAHCARE